MVSVRGAYVYMEDLRKVQALRPPPTHFQPIVPPALGVVSTPLIASAWEAELQSHPDCEFADFVVDGIMWGFRIGFDYSWRIGGGVVHNMRSATEHPEPIHRYLQEELHAGRVVRLNGREEGVSGIHVSRFGVIPKPHQPGKWRLITHLSSPKGRSA